jgi:hypothetical protein
MTLQHSTVTFIRRGVVFEFLIDGIRRGLNDRPRQDDVTAATVRFETTSGVAAGGPYVAAYDVDLSGWVAQCAARTEAVDTVLTVIASWTIAGQPYEQPGTLRIIA